MSASSKKKLRKEQNAAALTEKQLKEQKETKKLRNQTITFVVVIALVLALGLGSLAVAAYNNSGITERLGTALTVGEHSLSTAELSYFYYDVINSTYQDWYNTYGDYTATYVSMLYGIDLTKPLNEQTYDEENGTTYADYFIDVAVENAVSTYTLYDLAVANGHTLDDAGKAAVDSTIESLESAYASVGYSSLSDYLKSFYGKGATTKGFRNYLEVMYVVDAFQQDTYYGLTYTDSDLAAYSEEHFDEFSSFTYDTFYVSVSDLLVCTADEEDEDHEHSQEEADAALEAAKDVTDSLLDAKPATTEDFNKAISALEPYAEDESAACIEMDAALYTSISNAEIAQWLVESDRKAGDMTVITHTNETTDEDGNTVSTPYAYTVVLFHERNDNDMKLVNVRHILNAFTDGTTDELGNTVYPEASIQKSEEAVTILQNLWIENGMSEENFAELAKENSDDSGSVATGGLYEDIYPGQMVPTFNDWCFDEARQPGDYGIVKTDYGYHLMYFVSHSAVTYRNYMIENTLRNTDYNNWYQEQVDAAVYTVNDTSKMKQDVVIAG